MSLGGLYALWQTIADRSAVSKTYATAHGRQQSWLLSDGSTIHLDTDTAVTVRLYRASVAWRSTAEQIAVTVHHDPRRPFHVRAGAADAVAVGTEFDVYRIADSTTVTVLAGLVAVSVPAATARTVQVGAGQKVSVVDGLLPLAASPANARAAIAWLSGKIAFERRPLGEVAAELESLQFSRCSIDDPELRAMPISGSFDARDAEFIPRLPELARRSAPRASRRPLVQVLRAPAGSAAPSARARRAAF